jgi:hypothetical protein
LAAPHQGFEDGGTTLLALLHPRPFLVAFAHTAFLLDMTIQGNEIFEIFHEF